MDRHGDDTRQVEAEQRARVLLDREWLLSLGGVPAPASGGSTFDVVDPYTEEVVAVVPDGGPEDARRAVDLARGASLEWAATPVRERAARLRALADRIEERAEDLAIVDSVDSGAPLTVMLADVRSAIESLRYFAGLSMETKGFTVPASENLHFTERTPWGVVARIVPFNHPFMFAAGKIAAPLAAGNAVVLKPSETTPLSALLLGELAADILPPGTLSVVVGDGRAVPETLVRHPAVPRIGFTGSAATGMAIQRSAAEVAVKSISLELGGKNALVAFADADPGDVARAAIKGMNFTWSGQSCGSTSRLLLHEEIADEVLALVAADLAGREYVSPLHPRSVQGTMVNRRQYDKVLAYIDGALERGAQVIAGGGRPASAEKGLFIEPTFLDGVEAEWPVATEEIFGPVVSVLRWREVDEAVRIANDVEYGLTASVFSRDIGDAHRMARRLEAGFVWVNDVGPHYLGLPYGGWKNSGLGGEEDLDELLSFTRTKATTVRL